jgi:hypothetical protein
MDKRAPSISRDMTVMSLLVLVFLEVSLLTYPHNDLPDSVLEEAFLQEGEVSCLFYSLGYPYSIEAIQSLLIVPLFCLTLIMHDRVPFYLFVTRSSITYTMYGS